jgi:Flp pilus assembly protein TadD
MGSLVLMRRLLHHRLVLALLVSALAPAARADTWIEVRSPHLSVVTDAGEDRGRELALQFEQMRALFGTLLLRNRVNLPAPLRIVAFRDSSDFRRFTAGGGNLVAVSSVFQSGEDYSFILLDLSAGDSRPAALHDFAHLLLAGNYPRTQPWFDEGFAEYFSSIRIELKQVEAGRPPASTLGLQASALLPVTELLAVPRGSKIYDQSGDRRSVFHAESWLLVRYLFENDKLTQAADYFDLVHNQRLPVAEALRRAFGMEPAQLDRILREAASPLRSSKRVFEAPAGVDDAGYSAAKLDEADTKAVLADLHLHSPGSLDQAMREFQEALALSPHHAAAHRGLGCAYLAKQQLAQADEHFRQAARVEPDNALLHYYFALLIERQGAAAGGRIEDPWDMKREAEAAISLAPDFAGAYNLLAAAEVSIGNLEAAIADMKKAVRFSPRNDHYAANLAQNYLLAQKWEDAAALFEYLQASDDPQIAASAADDLKLLPALRRTPPPVVARRERPQDWSQFDDPQWRRRIPAPAQPENAAPQAAASTTSDSRPIKFLKGKLVHVECSQPPAALLTILSGKKTWKLRVADSHALVLVGADSFSCDWRNRDVAVNFREGGQADGDLVSLELD